MRNNVAYSLARREASIPRSIAAQSSSSACGPRTITARMPGSTFFSELRTAQHRLSRSGSSACSGSVSRSRRGHSILLLDSWGNKEEEFSLTLDGCSVLEQVTDDRNAAQPWDLSNVQRIGI